MVVIRKKIIIDKVMGYSNVLGPRLVNLGLVLEDELTTAFGDDTVPRKLMRLVYDH